MTIQELGNFEYDQEKGGNIPKDVKALTGTTVRLSGYMIPLDQADKIKQFVLVPDLFACCFGQPPQVQHSIIVTCPEGKAVSYFPEQIQVEGKLKVEEKKDDGFIVSIFEVDVHEREAGAEVSRAQRSVVTGLPPMDATLDYTNGRPVAQAAERADQRAADRVPR